MGIAWGVDVFNPWGRRTTVTRERLAWLLKAGFRLPALRTVGEAPDGAVLLDLADCGVGDCCAALAAARWLSDAPDGRPLWVACRASCAFLFAGLAERVITGEPPATGWGLRLDAAAALQQGALDHADRYSAVELLCELAGAHPAVPCYEPPPADVATARAGSRPLVLLQPLSSCPAKDWPLECWCALAARLVDGSPPAAVAVTHSGPIDWPDGSLLPDVLDLCGAPLGRVAAVVAAAALTVAPDSAIFHLSAAVGAPALGLFGPTGGAEHCRWYPQARVIQAEPPDGLAALSVGRVEDVCREMLEEAGDG